LSRRKQIIEEHFETADWQDDWSPRYNIAPTQPVPIIRQHPKEPTRQLSLMKWGLIPSWAKSPSANGVARRSSRSASRSVTVDCSTFAGLWERWRDPSGQWVKSCSIQIEKGLQLRTFEI
jgi:putative SOS response-associated peptidase YedK